MKPAVPDAPQVLWTDAEHHLGRGHGAVFPLHRPEEPRVDYVVTDEGGICLRAELHSRSRVPRSPLPLVRIDEIRRDGMRMARITLTQQHLLRDFHDLLNAVAERIVVGRRTPDQAFQETVRAWSALLERPQDLGPERRIGLMGELAVLAGLAEHHGWNTAVASWKGPEGEEHDFGLPDFDVEVKTTVGERRHHFVQGLGQLTATPGRPLWVVSHRLTRGGAQGRTLTECVLAVRARITDEAPSAVDEFDHHVRAAGWSRERPDDEHWSFRGTPPRAPSSLTLPADRVPALDARLLEGLPGDFAQRIDNVTYRIDLDGIEPPPVNLIPPELRTFRLP